MANDAPVVFATVTATENLNKGEPQTLEVVACSSQTFKVAFLQAVKTKLPRVFQWCETVTIDRCVDVPEPVDITAPFGWFVARANGCTDPVIVLTTQDSSFKINQDGTAEFTILPEHTCCYRGRLVVLDWSLGIGSEQDGEKQVAEIAHGSLWIRPNAAGDVLNQIIGV